MNGKAAIVAFAVLLIAVGGIVDRADCGEPETEGDAFVARLVHPDRQAAEVLRLFAGARWSDPAAALAAWKQNAGNAVAISKPAEAVIAFFNSEMAAEWRALDGAEIRVEVDATTGGLEWLAIVPRDDGTVAAGVTAMRLTYPDDRPLAVDGHELPVARLGRPGAPLGCQVGTAVVVASSRGILLRGVRLAMADGTASAGHEARGTAQTSQLESGTVFRLEPERISVPGSAPLNQRRAIEAIHALGCRRIDGAATLKDGVLSLDVSTTVEARRPRPAVVHPRAVERAWLEGLPADGVMAMVSLAIDPGSASWEWAFAVADRIERVDPARAGVAPLRTRLNLMAAGAGLKLEADLRPHLQGVTACVFGDPAGPGRVGGGVIVLHLDQRDAAERTIRQSARRIGGLAPDRAVAVRARGGDAWIAWGDAGTTIDRVDRPDPARSLAAACGGWAAEGCDPPARVGAIWPARLWRLGGGPEVNPAALRVLADDPPVVWWGWSEPEREHDLLRWPGLSGRLRRLLELLPPALTPDGSIPRSRTAGFQAGARD
jgi:hypothetical protein